MRKINEDFMDNIDGRDIISSDEISFDHEARRKYPERYSIVLCVHYTFDGRPIDYYRNVVSKLSVFFDRWPSVQEHSDTRYNNNRLDSFDEFVKKITSDFNFTIGFDAIFRSSHALMWFLSGLYNFMVEYLPSSIEFVDTGSNHNTFLGSRQEYLTDRQLAFFSDYMRTGKLTIVPDFRNNEFKTFFKRMCILFIMNLKPDTLVGSFDYFCKVLGVDPFKRLFAIVPKEVYGINKATPYLLPDVTRNAIKGHILDLNKLIGEPSVQVVYLMNSINEVYDKSSSSEQFREFARQIGTIEIENFVAKKDDLLNDAILMIKAKTFIIQTDKAIWSKTDNICPAIICISAPDSVTLNSAIGRIFGEDAVPR